MRRASGDPSIELNHFKMLVPKSGYRWIDSKRVSRLHGYVGSPPFLTVNPIIEGKRQAEVDAHSYFPLIEEPTLFCRFRELDLNQNAILSFANRYGSIGPTGGFYEDEIKSLVPGTGLNIWFKEIQALVLADHLWQCVQNDDRRTLRNYFEWDPRDFKVWMHMGLERKDIIKKNDPRLTDPSRTLQMPFDLLNRELVGHHDVRELQAIGCNRGDVLGPARLAISWLVNEKLQMHCYPRLFLHKEKNLVGHLTAANLLGCIWLQFYLSIVGQVKIRICTVCEQPMDVTANRSSKRMHDSCSKRLRMQRWRNAE